MKNLSQKDLEKFVETHIGEFHGNRIAKLRELRLRKVMASKNPYLFKAKHLLTAEAIVRTIVDAYISSSEEATFGSFLETLAVFVCSKIYNGQKSSAPNIDLEFNRGDIKYIVSIKSGPKWGNSSQVKKMQADFKTAKKILGTNASKTNVVAVNGCCYGREATADKGDYIKLCGQSFWEFISGNPNLYTEIIEPIGHKAKEKNEEYLKSYAQIVNTFTGEFLKDFCDDGVVNWKRIVEFNSSTKKSN